MSLDKKLYELVEESYDFDSCCYEVIEEDILTKVEQIIATFIDEGWVPSEDFAGVAARVDKLYQRYIRELSNLERPSVDTFRVVDVKDAARRASGVDE